MEHKNNRRKSCYRKILVIALFLLFSTNLFSREFSYELNKTEIQQWSVFSLECLIQSNDYKYVSIESELEQDVYEIYGDPLLSFYPPTKDEQNGLIKLTLRFMAKKNGYHIFKPIELKIDNEKLVTENINISIGSLLKNKIVVPPEVEWYSPQEEAYLGQNIPVYLVLKNRREIRQAERVSFSTSNRIFLEEIRNDFTPIRHEIGNVGLIDTAIMAYYFSSEIVGDINLPWVDVNFPDLGSASVKPIKIKILDLPEEVKTTSGAVGNFSIKYRSDQSNKSLNEQINFIVTISGIGNFNNFKMPKVSYENLIQVDAQETSNYVKNQTGWAGQKSISYTFIPEKIGIASIDVAPFYSFSPKTKDVKFSTQKNYSYNIIAESFLEEIKTDNDYKFITGDEVCKSKTNLLRYDLIKLLYFSPALICLLILIIFLIVKKVRLKKLSLTLMILLVLQIFFSAYDSKLVADINLAKTEYENANYTDALNKLKVLENRLEKSPDFNYNLSLCYNMLEDPVNAIFYIQKSILHDSTNKLYVDFYNHLNEKNNITHSIKRDILPLNKISFFILAISIDLFAISVVLLVLLKNRYLIVAILVTAIMISICIPIFIYNTSKNYEKYVVLNEETFLKRIPKENSINYYNLKKGTLLYKDGEINDYYLVDNRLGISGWIKKENVIIFP